MTSPRKLILLLGYLFATGLACAQNPSGDIPKQQIEHVLAIQASAWNRGDIEGFMEGYAKSPALRFASGDSVTYGWQNTLDRYKERYPDRAAMGTLNFSDLETTVLSPDAAVVFGRWRLKTEKGEPHGLFTLVFRKDNDAWHIVADHTSAAAPGH